MIIAQSYLDKFYCYKRKGFLLIAMGLDLLDGTIVSILRNDFDKCFSFLCPRSWIATTKSF